MAEGRIYTTDTAVIEAALMDEEGEGEVPVASATVQISNPFGQQLLVPALPTTPEVGDRVQLTDNVGLFTVGNIIEWDGAQWNFLGPGGSVTIDDNIAFFRLSGLLTGQSGLYTYRFQFSTADGAKHSVNDHFEVLDPFQGNDLVTPLGVVVDHAWMKLEDLFDSELGGPWLADETRRSFNRDKLARLLPDALYLVNNGYQPITEFTDENFPLPHYPLVAQALLCEAIYHLARSYVEQYLPIGSNITYFDRRDYLTRWQSVLAMEEKKLGDMMGMFKLQYTGFGSTSILVGGYSTPMTRMSKLWRPRHAKYIGPWT